jgi:predicted benzoate:H+ symporter BenE
MEGMKAIPYIALVIAISGIVLGASAIVLAKFNDTTTDTAATAAIQNASDAIGDVAEQLPTVAIIGIMVIIISVIAGVFVYLRYFA